jgi:ATP-binding cassette subfamily B protein RaxB
MQEDKLFSGSLAENISFFDPEINMDLVIKSATQAMIHQEIMQTPMKYESLIGDMGTALSGGQIQRVILARALYRKPKILFMDEGTAHLDVTTERAIIKSVTALGITRIIIAHRAETINSADRILSFEKGKLTEIKKKNSPRIST